MPSPTPPLRRLWVVRTISHLQQRPVQPSVRLERLVDECSIEELFEAMDLPWDGFESELHDAVSDVLERMEAANKVLYREGVIHLL